MALPGEVGNVLTISPGGFHYHRRRLLYPKVCILIHTKYLVTTGAGGAQFDNDDS